MKDKELLAALAPLGFENSGDICYGTWKGYPVALRKEAILSTRYIVRVGACLDNLTGNLRKALRGAVNSSNLLRGSFNVELVTKEEVICSVSFAGSDDPAALFANRMDALTAALLENGIAPGNSCIISSMEDPDNLCPTDDDNDGRCQPFFASEAKVIPDEIREPDEEEYPDSRRSSIIGAVLGMIIGTIPTLLALYIGWVFPPAFLLIPLATVFGYKLFRGRMDATAVKIVISVSLIGVVLLPLYVELVSFFVHGEWMTPRDALLLNVKSFFSSEVFPTSALNARLLISLLFFGAGIGIAWREIYLGM